MGFRGIDTACQPKHYNEPGVGDAIVFALERGLSREELYLQTKFTPLDGQDPARVPYDPDATVPEQIRQSCRTSLANLRTTFLDCLLLHSPLDSLEATEEAWHAFETLVDQGTVRAIGVSNCYDIRWFQHLYSCARVKPSVLQNRFYAKTGFDRAMRQFCRERNVVYQSFWTLTANPKIIAHKTIAALANIYEVTSEQIFFRALTQIGIVPLTGTCSEEHMRQDLAIFDFELSADDVARVTSLCE
jgi:diketogulonate reductase-like aldo/keto reductase